MKRIILIIFVIIACIKGVQAQDLYRVAMKDYVENNILMFEQHINGFTKPLNLITKKLLTNYDESHISALIDDYRKSQLIDDLVDSLLIPVYKDEITLEELQKLNALLQSPEGKTYQVHCATMTKNAYGESKELKDMALRIYGYILKNEPLKDIKINKKISKEYRNKYYQIADKSFISYFTNALSNLYKDQFNGKEELFDTISSYLNRNIEAIVINLFFESMTSEDLDFMLKVKEIGAQQRMEKALKGMADNIVPYIQKLYMAYAKWLLRQQEVCEYMLRKIVDDINQKAKTGDNRLTCDLDEKRLSFIFAGDTDMLDLTALRMLFEQDKDAVLSEMSYNLHIFENEDLLRTVAYSQRAILVLFKNKITEEKLELEYSNQDVKQMLDHFQSLSLTRKGIQFYDDKSYEKALPLLKQAAEEGDCFAQYKLSQMYYYGMGTLKNKEEAMKWLTIVSKQNKNKKYKAEALNEIAYYYFDQKQYDKALTMIESAIEIRPNEANYYDSKGEILYFMGDKKGAKEMWNKVITLEPDFMRNHNSNLYKVLYGGKNKK